MIEILVSQSPDIQKVLAFEGAFEKLFNTVTQEGGVDGGVVAQSALSCVDSLLRFNSANQVRATINNAICSLTLACRGTFERRLYHPSSLPFFNSRQTFLLTKLRHKSSLFSSGMSKSASTCR